MRNVTVAAVQMQCGQNLAENLATAERLSDRQLVRGRKSSFCQNSLSVPISVKKGSMIITPMLSR